MNHKVKYVRQRSISGNTYIRANVRFTRGPWRWRGGWAPHRPPSGSQHRHLFTLQVLCSTFWGVVLCHVAVTAIHLLLSFPPSPLASRLLSHSLPFCIGFQEAQRAIHWANDPVLPSGTIITFLFVFLHFSLNLCIHLQWYESSFTITNVKDLIEKHMVNSKQTWNRYES